MQQKMNATQRWNDQQVDLIVAVTPQFLALNMNSPPLESLSLTLKMAVTKSMASTGNAD